MRNLLPMYHAVSVISSPFESGLVGTSVFSLFVLDTTFTTTNLLFIHLGLVITTFNQKNANKCVCFEWMISSEYYDGLCTN